MSRQILDNIVFERIDSAKIARTSFTTNPMYVGTVTDSLTKVKLEKSEFGMRDYGTCQHAKEFFNSIKLRDGETYIMVNDKKFNTSASMVKMIKTLAVEQVNKNEEYSVALSHCLSVVLRAAIGKMPVNSVLPVDSMSDFQKIVVKDFSDWIGSLLGEQNEK